MVMLVSVALLFAGCGGNDVQQNQEQQEGQQNVEEVQPQDEANPAGADVQSGQTDVVTMQGQFQGLADGHSAEITVDGEPVVFQFFDEAVAAQLEIMETGTALQFDVENDAETGVKTIVKLYEAAE